MATKDDRLFLKGNRKSYSFAANNDNQFTNLNLNQNHQCSILSKNFASEGYQNYRKSNGDYYCDNKKDTFISWNKFSKDLNESKSFHRHHAFEEKSLKPSKSNAINSNSGTLSLHIAAYENAVKEASDESNTAKVIKQKKSKTTKDIFENSSLKCNYEVLRNDPNITYPSPFTFTPTQLLAPAEFGELISGRPFYTSFGVLSALAPKEDRHRCVLYFSRIIYLIALLVKVFMAFKTEKLFEPCAEYFLVPALIGFALGSVVSFCIDQKKEYFLKRVFTSRRGIKLTKKKLVNRITGEEEETTSILGLLPCFALSFLAMLCSAELSKDHGPFKTEMIGCFYDLGIFFVSNYRGGKYLFKISDLLSARAFPHLPANI